MARVYYVDTAVPSDRKKRRRHKTHAVFDGVRVFRVKKLTELEDASEIYIDALFPQIYEELMELIERNVKIFLLKNTRLLKRLREENGVEKSDEADAKLLSTIPKNHFKQLTAREVEQLTVKEINLLKLMKEYEMYVRWKKTIRQWMRIRKLDRLEECAKELQCLVKQYARRIIKEVKNNENYATTYRLVCKELGLKESFEVATLVVKLPLNWRLHRLKGLLGLTPYKSKNYNHRLRAHLSSLATSIYLNSRQYGVSTELLKDLEGLPPRAAICKLELKILRILKIAWQQQKQRMLAGGQ